MRSHGEDAQSSGSVFMKDRNAINEERIWLEVLQLKLSFLGKRIQDSKEERQPALGGSWLRVD